MVFTCVALFQVSMFCRISSIWQDAGCFELAGTEQIQGQNETVNQFK